jgi:hypothetical protein
MEITHLEAVDGRRASLDITLINADVHFASTNVCTVKVSRFRKA